jgi:Uma2 family endonuclease
MRVLSNGNAREPDIFFIERQHTNRLTSRQLEGPADLAIEIISEESVNRDRVDKFYEYQKGGVREYWIIDPREGRQRVDLYVLDETGRYQPVPPEVGGIYRSVVIPGFWLREAWLWQENPNVLAALTEVVGVERMIEAVRQSS